MLDNIKQEVKKWDWKSQNIWEWDNKEAIATLISRIDRWYYKTKEIEIDLKVHNLATDNFTCNSLFDFLTHMQLVKNAKLKYPVIVNNRWEVIDWRHRICKAIMQGKKSIKWVMIMDCSVI